MTTLNDDGTMTFQIILPPDRYQELVGLVAALGENYDLQVRDCLEVTTGVMALFPLLTDLERKGNGGSQAPLQAGEPAEDPVPGLWPDPLVTDDEDLVPVEEQIGEPVPTDPQEWKPLETPSNTESMSANDMAVSILEVESGETETDSHEGMRKCDGPDCETWFKPPRSDSRFAPGHNNCRIKELNARKKAGGLVKKRGRKAEEKPASGEKQDEEDWGGKEAVWAIAGEKRRLTRKQLNKALKKGELKVGTKIRHIGGGLFTVVAGEGYKYRLQSVPSGGSA